MRVLLADDHTLFRAGLTALLGDLPGMDIVGEAGDGAAAVALAIEDHYKPRFAGDELPRNMTGVVVALADKLETLVGMFI